MDYAQGARTTADSNAEGRMVVDASSKKKKKRSIIKKILRRHC